ncbi:protein LNK1-like isoform X2 [Phoenix dactylifera]|uniref:Protein LNK1-like isoform X2 n=1 Tax=Phoenix dactylifera TaxID=42345 RepID=A0A8B8J6W0_PHODC|nr:protein LNK1-like isoform X2 [Phoenix dactylifera]
MRSDPRELCTVLPQDRLMKRMSDWSSCKLVDNWWDEFAQSGVFIVPHRDGEKVNESVAVSNAYRHLGNNVGESTGSSGVAKTVPWRKEKPYLVPPMNHGSCDPECIHNAITMVSQDAEVSDSCTKGSNVNPGVKDTCLLENGHGDGENDLAYYDWPDIGNFEDIDNMFRFGQGSTDDANDLSWFPSSSHSIYGSEITFDSGLQSSCSDLNVLNNSSEHQSANTNFLPEIDSPSAVIDNSSTVGYQFDGDWLDSSAGNEDEFASKELYDKRAEMKLSALNQTCSGSEDLNMITDIGSQYLSEEKIIQPFAERKLPSSAISAAETWPSECMLEPKHLLGSASSSYMHTSNPHSKLEYNFPTHQVPFTLRTLSNAFENDTDLSSSDRVLDNVTIDSYQYIKRLPKESSLPPTMTPGEKMEKHKQQLHGSVTVDHKHQQTSCTSKTMVMKNHHRSQHEKGCSSEQEERSIGLSAIDKDSSIMQENSFMTTVSSDDISLEATSFQQLQDVVDQLDVRTKRCIRDSLYRLAKSARQRHIFSNASNCSRESRDARVTQSTATSNRCPKLTNAETETNPIDRSIAHLLFHKPSDPPTGPADYALSFESLIIGRVPVSNQAGLPDLFVSQKQVGNCRSLNLPDGDRL